jgi:uncharacterized membrane protein YeaQ/YmgE (transglycosylase-associated protein family)
MSISNELMLAILAMDSYNRGYNAGICPKDIGLGLVGSQIGNAIVDRIDGEATAQAASFFALSYSYNGQTVISYRGTDAKLWDLWNGYGLAVGSPYSLESRLAVEFFKSVVKGSSDSEPTSTMLRNANVTLTGHSLELR